MSLTGHRRITIRAIGTGGMILALSLLAAAQLDGMLRQSVITRQFDWRKAVLPHFEIYYYDAGGDNLLPLVGGYLQEAYGRSTRTLPIASKHTFPYILFNSHNEFEQTNVTTIGEGTGGVTEAFKDRILVGNTGSQRALEYVTCHEFTHAVQYVYLFGGFWRSAQLLRFPFYPSWLMEGLAEYNAGDLDYVTREMYLRDASLDGGLLPLDHLFNFNHVKPHQVTLAYKQSEALLHYIAAEYGEEKLAVMLSTYRTRVYAEAVLKTVLGVDQTTLDKRFRESLRDSYKVLSRGLKEPGTYGRRLTSPGPYPSFNVAPVYSPDGKKLAYLSDRHGAQEVYLKDLESGKTELAWSMARSLRVEEIHNEDRSLAFSPDGKTLVFIGEKEQKDHLCLMDVPSRKLEMVSLGMDTLSSPAWSPDGSQLYVSGIKDGMRDIYVLRLSDRHVTRLTTGAMDEIGAAPSADGKYLYYSGERKNDKGRIEYDIFRMDLADGTTADVTAFPGDERFPALSEAGDTMYFVSDQDGVSDIYRMSLPDGSPERLTTVIGGNFYPRLSPDGKRLVFSSFRHTEMHIYEMELPREKVVSKAAPLLFSTTAPEIEAPGFTAERKGPYRPAFSTDLFYPFIAYSSLDGLYLLAYWQVSDFMGNHQVGVSGSFATAAEYIDYTAAYGFLKYRPQFYLSLTGREYYRDIDMREKLREHGQILQVVYPFDRSREIALGLGTISRKETVKDAHFLDTDKRENAVSLSFMQDNTFRTYLEITRGDRFMVSGQFADRVLYGTYRYQNYAAENQVFFPLGKEHVLFWRATGGISAGDDAGDFFLGGVTGVRGVPQDKNRFAGNRVFSTSFEWRFPLVHDINYHVWFFFPDFFFKTLYGTIFTDAGVVWDNTSDLGAATSFSRWKGSYGVGLRFQTFVLESQLFPFNFYLSRRMDGPEYAFYVSSDYSFSFIFPFFSRGAYSARPSSRMPRGE